MYYQDTLVKLYNSDCRNMSELGDNSIDLIVTDPPYGISFMGKDWDKALPSKEIWKECLRVLKDGAFAFVMSIPRADCLSRMIISLEDAGFRVNFTPIFWAQAQGFPKAQNIGKMVDKRLGAEREVIGTTQYADGSKGRETAKHYQGESLGGQSRMTKPTTPQAKALDGSYGGFQPKPSVEVIIVAMKPLSEKTYVDQALKNGKGITWLDEGRIPYKSKEDEDASIPGRVTGGLQHFGNRDIQPDLSNKFPKHNEQGRFPANLLVSDDVLNDGKITKSRLSGGKDANDYSEYSIFKLGGITGNPNGEGHYPDSGSFSRYFSLDSWWAERIKLLPASVQKTFPFLIISKASKSEKNKGLTPLPLFGEEGLPEKQSQDYGEGYNSEAMLRNYHPTVKPLKLMSYLITLGSREGDTILDPFLGSGTTAVACQLLSRGCIGIELDENYCQIAVKRIEAETAPML